MYKCQIPLQGPDPTTQIPRTCRPGSPTQSGRARLVTFGLNPAQVFYDLAII